MNSEHWIVAAGLAFAVMIAFVIGAMWALKQVFKHEEWFEAFSARFRHECRHEWVTRLWNHGGSYTRKLDQCRMCESWNPPISSSSLGGNWLGVPPDESGWDELPCNNEAEEGDVVQIVEGGIPEDAPICEHPNALRIPMYQPVDDYEIPDDLYTGEYLDCPDCGYASGPMMFCKFGGDHHNWYGKNGRPLTECEFCGKSLFPRLPIEDFVFEQAKDL